MEYIRQLLVAKYGEAMVYKGGLKVFTTLNMEMQKAAEAAFAAGLRELDKRQGWRGPLRTVDVTAPTPPTVAATTDQAVKVGDYREGFVTKVAKDHYLVQVGTTVAKLAFDDMAWAKRRLTGSDTAKDVVVNPNLKQVLKPGDVIEVMVKKLDRDIVHVQLEQTPLVEGGLIALEPGNGAIRAMVGGYDFGRSEYNRAVQAHRQPGSAFKPIIYATAVSQGMSPASVILDAPVVYEQEQDEKTWKPENYGKKFHGMVSLRDALAHSHNLATVRLLDKVGVKNVIEFAKTVGITSPLAADLSLGLGSSSVGLMELTSAYSVLLNQGNRAEPYAILFVKDNAGKVLEQEEPQAIGGDLQRNGVLDYEHDGRRDPKGDRSGGQSNRSADCGENRHHGRVYQCVVYRRCAELGFGHLRRVRRSTFTRRDGIGGPCRAAHLDQFHERRAQADTGHGLYHSGRRHVRQGRSGDGSA